MRISRLSITKKPLRKANFVAHMCWFFFILSFAADAARLVWHSGFEKGFPGNEWLAFAEESFSKTGVIPVERTSAWTIVNRLSSAPVYSGNHAYKGWVAGPSDNSHRAYPVIHADFPTPLINTLMVYLEADYGRMSSSDWIHFGTWGNHNPETKTGRWALHTMAVRNRKLEFAHTSPFNGEYIGRGKQSDFPLRRWVRLTTYIHYQGTSGLVQVWQDGTPMLRARVSQLEQNPGTHLKTAHWGMYASGTLGHGIQYNDDIRICTLDNPLTDLAKEPVCPAGKN